ncbi:MAG: hypothetical protein EB149_00480 [Thaumarchaeota archaeon]|nr:hypothetical protein [Nitrososphaerota archaeon]
MLASLLILAVSTPLAFASSDQEKTLKQCEGLYPEFETLGKLKFLERYMHQPNIRSCLTLYNDIAWFSEDSDRADRLIALLAEPITPKQVRDRFDRTDSIPQWIKNDALRWYQGKELDNTYSYGIRFLINSKMIDISGGTSDQTLCDPDRICVVKDNYIRYSIKYSQSNDITNLTHTFGDPGDIIAISSAETTKKDKIRDNFHIDSDGIIGGTKQYYRFVHKIPSELGVKINSAYEIKTANEVVFPFKNQQRDAVVAWDKTKQYQEVIDKQTGIVLFAKYTDRIKKTQWSADLTDTNAFSKETKIQYKKMSIPSWIKGTVKWWVDGEISDEEYLRTIGYLLKNDVMRI